MTAPQKAAALNPLAPKELVRINSIQPDPALDMTAEELKRYGETRDPELLKFKEGMEPTRFVMAPLSRMYVACVLDAEPHFERKLVLAFLASCHAVRVAGVPAPVSPDPSEFVELPHGMRRAPDSWMERVARKYTLATVFELGTHAIARARLAEDESLPL